MLGFGANILVAHSEASRGREALAKLDFYAHADMFMSQTAELADVILPVCLGVRARRDAQMIGV